MFIPQAHLVAGLAASVNTRMPPLSTAAGAPFVTPVSVSKCFIALKW